MEEQSSEWEEISKGFVSDAIVSVHRVITLALTSICDNGNSRDARFAKAPMGKICSSQYPSHKDQKGRPQMPIAALHLPRLTLCVHNRHVSLAQWW
jgi:hypothetical protein